MLSVVRLQLNRYVKHISAVISFPDVCVCVDFVEYFFYRSCFLLTVIECSAYKNKSPLPAKNQCVGSAAQTKVKMCIKITSFSVH